MLRISTGWCMRHAKSAVLLTNSAPGKAAVLAVRSPRATHSTIRPPFRALPLLLSLAMFIGGCSALSSTGAFLDAPQLKINPMLLVATTRDPIDGARAKPWFGTERATAMTLARGKLVPPDEGRFSLSAVGLGDWHLESIEPVQNLSDLIGLGPEKRDILIYVHGFNQTFESAALDAARLSDGVRFHGETMVFSWPSKAKLFDYGYDRESAMWSRDALERILSRLIANPGVGRIHLVAHSVGTMLSMEALRQIYARHGHATGKHSWTYPYQFG